VRGQKNSLIFFGNAPDGRMADPIGPFYPDVPSNYSLFIFSY